MASAQSATLVSGASALGRVAPFREAQLAAEAAGRVTARNVEPGDRVQAGQTLVRIDDERPRIALAQATAQLAVSRAMSREAASELRRGEGLKAENFLSDEQLERLRFRAERAQAESIAAEAALAGAERTLADTNIQAPFNGTVEAVQVQLGDYVKVGNPVVRVADFSRVRVRAGITGSEATLLAVGQTVQLSLDHLADERLTGRLQSLARTADSSTGTYAVEVWLDAGTLTLRAGMIATMHLPFTAPPVALAVPAAAVFRQQGAHHVFVVEDDLAQLRQVAIGRTDSTWVEIKSGLETGAQVVVEGQFALGDGVPVVVTAAGG